MKCPKCDGNLVTTVDHLGDETIKIVFQCEDCEEHRFYITFYQDELEDN